MWQFRSTSSRALHAAPSKSFQPALLPPSHAVPPQPPGPSSSAPHTPSLARYPLIKPIARSPRHGMSTDMDSLEGQDSLNRPGHGRSTEDLQYSQCTSSLPHGSTPLAGRPITRRFTSTAGTAAAVLSFFSQAMPASAAKKVELRDGTSIEVFEHGMSLTIVALRGSVPSQWILEFKQTLGKYAGFAYGQRGQLAEIYKELPDVTGKNSAGAADIVVLMLPPRWQPHDTQQPKPCDVPSGSVYVGTLQGSGGGATPSLHIIMIGWCAVVGAHCIVALWRTLLQVRCDTPLCSLTPGGYTVVFADNTVVFADNTLVFADKTVVADNTVVFADNTVVSADNTVVFADNTGLN
eukprot:gene26686-4261_t